MLGVQADRAHRAAKIFRKYDEEGMRELFPHIDDEKAYISAARRHNANLENILRDDKERLAGVEGQARENDVPERLD